MIRTETWPFYRTSSGVRLFWELENLKDLKDHQKLLPPRDHPRALGIVLLHGPRRKLCLMGEVPLYTLACTLCQA